MVLVKSCWPGLQIKAECRVITNWSVFVPPLGIVQMLSPAKTQAAGLQALSDIGLNFSDIQVITKYYRTLQYK